MSAAAVVGFSHLRDQRHKAARSAGDQEAWLAWLELGGLSPITLSNYEWATARLLRAYPGVALHEFQDDHVSKVLRTFPPAGRRTKKAAYDSLFKWARKTRRITENPMDMLPDIPRRAQQTIETFTAVEIAELTTLPDWDGELCLILFDTGLRRSEATALQVRDIHLEDADLVVRRGKGDKGRVIPMTSRLTQRLSAWLLIDALRPHDHLWPTRPGGYELQRRKQMGPTSFSMWWRRTVDKAGVTYRNPHVTRHTFATRWLKRGGTLLSLSRAMGHSSIRVTADLYAHLDLSDIRRELERIEAAESDLTERA